VRHRLEPSLWPANVMGGPRRTVSENDLQKLRLLPRLSAQPNVASARRPS